MSHLLHLAASPRGPQSASLAIADAFLDAYRRAHPADTIETWNLWDGSLPEFGPDAANAKMAVFAGAEPTGGQVAAWQAARAAFERFDRADTYLFSVPMWNAGVPYVLKQFIDVVSQPGWIFDVDADEGYRHLLAGRGKRAMVVYTGAVWGPKLGPEFGSDFQQPYFDDWLRWTGITDIRELRFHPTLTGDHEAELDQARADAREIGNAF